MEYLIGLLALVIGGAIFGVLAWGVSVIKERWDLDPSVIQTFEHWKNKILEWVLDKAEEQGADLNLPETRWKFVNQAIDAFIGYIPKIMDGMGYSRKDLADEVERAVKRFMKDKVNG